MEKLAVLAFCFLLLFSMFPPFISKVSAQEIVQFSPLQEKVNNAKEGSRIRVEPGTYYGVTKVNKSLTLVGDDVILDANGWHGALIISASNVIIEGFTVLNASRYEKGYPNEEISEFWISPEMMGSGIYVYFAKNIDIFNITITKCYAGIGFTHSSQPNYITNSTIARTFWGIILYASYVEIFNSVIRDNTFAYTLSDGTIMATGGGGIDCYDYSQMNLTYTTLLNTNWAISIAESAYYSNITHNNFINNAHNVFIHPDAQREVANWTYNYWSDYIGVDLCSGLYQNETGSDGFGDTPYVIDYYNQDNYPLMEDPQLNQPKPKVFRREGGRGFSKPLCT